MKIITDRTLEGIVFIIAVMIAISVIVEMINY